MNLQFILIRESEVRRVPVLSVFGHLVSQSRDDYLTNVLYLSIRLRIVFSTTSSQNIKYSLTILIRKIQKDLSDTKRRD